MQALGLDLLTHEDCYARRQMARATARPPPSLDVYRAVISGGITPEQGAEQLNPWRPRDWRKLLGQWHEVTFALLFLAALLGAILLLAAPGCATLPRYRDGRHDVTLSLTRDAEAAWGQPRTLYVCGDWPMAPAQPEVFACEVLDTFMLRLSEQHSRAAPNGGLQ